MFAILGAQSDMYTLVVNREWTAFKFLDPFSGIATYPSGALRRVGVSSSRAIAIAVRDVPPRPPSLDLRRRPQRTARELCP